MKKILAVLLALSIISACSNNRHKRPDHVPMPIKEETKQTSAEPKETSITIQNSVPALLLNKDQTTNLDSTLTSVRRAMYLVSAAVGLYLLSKASPYVCYVLSKIVMLFVPLTTTPANPPQPQDEIEEQDRILNPPASTRTRLLWFSHLLMDVWKRSLKITETEACMLHGQAVGESITKGINIAEEERQRLKEQRKITRQRNMQNQNQYGQPPQYHNQFSQQYPNSQ